VASKKAANLEPRISESESTSATKEAADKNAHSNDSEAPAAAVVAGPEPNTPVATPSSPHRSSSAVALKGRLNQAIAKEKNIAPCRYKN
jgi:hypothetical protein